MKNDKYDIDHNVTSSQVEHGHSVHLRTHVPKYSPTLREILANSPSWPEYRSSQDIIRDALYPRVQWATEQHDREQYSHPQEALARGRLLARLRADEADASHREQMLGDIERSLARNLSCGDVDAARRTAEEAEGLMADLPQPFASRFAARVGEWRNQVGYVARSLT